MNRDISFWKTSFANGEAEAARDAVSNQHISQGPLVKKFEMEIANFLKVPYVVATPSGSMALVLGLLAAGIGPGDEVIVPNRSWIATAHAAKLLGAKVVFVDLETARPLIDVEKMRLAITKKTKAIIPVHINGRSADMLKIKQIASANNITVIEDAAQALGSKNQFGYLGTQGDLGCFSLSVAKIISTGQGGFVVTRDKKLYEKMVLLRTQGVGDVFWAKWNIQGLNFRFTDILASIGIVQLGLIEERISALKKLYEHYEKNIANYSDILTMLPVNLVSGEVPLYIEVISPFRDELLNFMKENKVELRPFYPDMSTADYFDDKNSYPNSKIYSEQGVYLPSGPNQKIDDINHFFSLVEKFQSWKRVKQ